MGSEPISPFEKGGDYKEACVAVPTRYTKELFREYTAAGYWTADTMASCWDRKAARYPDREAVVDSKTRLTWKQAKLWTDRMALGLLRLGLKKDEVVVVQLPNSVELTLLRVACEKVGLLCLPVLRTFRHSEMEHILRSSNASAIVILREFRGWDYRKMVEELRPRLPSLKHVIFAGDDVPPGSPSIREMVDRPLERDYPADYLDGKNMAWNEFCLVLHTSGTTGVPKLGEFPICCNLYQGKLAANRLGLTPEDIVFTLSPAAMGPSMTAHMAAPIAGSKIIMQEHFDAAEALEIIARERVTVVCAVPAQLTMLSTVIASAAKQSPEHKLSSLRVVRVTGSPLTFHVGKEAEDRLGVPVTQAYGAVDFGHLCSNGPEESLEDRILTVGRPETGNEIKLVDDSGHEAPQGEVGEVWARGPASISGYFNDPEATAAAWPDGWFHMGDLAKFDAGGRLLIVGRKKDMIIRGGQNIYPAEIEALLVTHPAIAAVAVVAMPDPVMGEKACAFVVAKPGCSLCFTEMVSFLKNKDIAPFKLPERLELTDKLPMVADGQKVDKKLLARHLSQGDALQK